MPNIFMVDMNNLLIKNKSGKQLKRLNESDAESPQKKYIFSGVFTACSVPGHKIINRNGRIYTEQEVLKHLGYLRDKIKADGCILGELDHPDGRFDVSLKEASHKIVDLWYDQSTHDVMGKIELLDTPNGKIAKALVDAGYPIYVSSRAAGDVDEKTHEVEIANIFTYDIVCTPGFEEARLDRVSESYRPQVKKILAEAAGTSVKDITKKFKNIDSCTTVVEMGEGWKEEINMKDYKMEEVTKPILAEEAIPQEKAPEQVGDPEVPGVDFPSMNPAVKTDDNLEVEADEDEHLNESPEEKSSKRDDIISIESVEANPKEKRGDIVSIEKGESTEEGDSEKEGAPEDNEEADAKEDRPEDREEVSDEEDEAEGSDEKVEECGDGLSVDECGEKCESKKVDKAVEGAEADEADVDDLLAKISKKREAKESIVSKWPFSISLSPSNFAKFVALSEGDRDTCESYIVANGIFDVKAINEAWCDGLKQEKKMQQAWLRLASDEDKALYVDAPIEVQDAIEESAKFLTLETKADVDAFWARTGLRQKKQAMIEREMLQEKYKEMYSGEDFDSELGYSKSLPELMQEAILKSDAAYRG